MHRAEAEYLALVARESRRAVFRQKPCAIAACPRISQAKMERALRDVRRHFREHSSGLAAGGRRNAFRCAAEHSKSSGRPGHSPGHVCLYSPEHRYLISGDHILQNSSRRISAGIRVRTCWRSIWSRLQAASLRYRPGDALARDAFRGHRAAIAKRRSITRSAAAEILEHITREPMTAHGIVQKVWPRGLSPFHHHFAVFEILAHLEFMQRRGHVRRNLATAGAAVLGALRVRTRNSTELFGVALFVFTGKGQL